jgi:alpha-amylase
MGVMMQAFYWDCPREENLEYQWWNALRVQIPALAEVGFSALWLPPVHKAANLNGTSMGYDPYDYYDLGDYDQKGSIPTWFGSKQDLLELITAAHQYNMSVLADMVINHNRQIRPGKSQQFERWTLFQPKSGKFSRRGMFHQPVKLGRAPLEMKNLTPIHGI